jgi:hypothetical protein
MFYLHVSEALVFLAQESQSPPRYSLVAPELIFGFWYESTTFDSYVVRDSIISQYYL